MVEWSDDPIAFMEEALHIITKQGKLELIKLNRAQRRILRKLAREGVRLNILKARQLGSSTVIILFYLWAALFRPHTRIAIVAHLDKSAKKIFQIAHTAYQALPEWFKQRKSFKATTSSTTELTFGMGSVFSVGTAQSGFWRGGSFSCGLLSEIAYYKSSLDTLGAILQAISDEGTIVLETTAKGSNEYHGIWTNPTSGYDNLFLSWLDDPLYVTDAVPVPGPTAEEQSYIARNKLPPERANWYVRTKRQKCRDDQKMFDQEYPVSPEVAFIVSGDRYFNRQFVVDWARKPQNNLGIWKAPIEGHLYSLGADVAGGGATGDASTMHVTDQTNPDAIEIVATYVGRLEPRLFAEDIEKVAKHYNNALICPEVNNHGLTVVDYLRTKGMRLYIRRSYSRRHKEWVEAYGWHTNQKTRPLLLSKLHQAITHGRINYIPDPRNAEELNGFAYNDRGIPIASSGLHDDTVFSLALSLEGADQITRPHVVLPEKMAPEGNREILAWELKHGTVWQGEDED